MTKKPDNLNTSSERVKEIMARALHEVEPVDSSGTVKWRYYLPEAHAAVEALEAAGFAIVPIEPTQAQIDAMRDVNRILMTQKVPPLGGEYAELYRAAIKTGTKT